MPPCAGMASTVSLASKASSSVPGPGAFERRRGHLYVLRAGEGSAIGCDFKSDSRDACGHGFRLDLPRPSLSLLWSQIQRRFDRHDDLSVRDGTLWRYLRYRAKCAAQGAAFLLPGQGWGQGMQARCRISVRPDRVQQCEGDEASRSNCRPRREGQVALRPARQRQGAWREDQGRDQGQSRDASSVGEIDL